MNRIVRMVFVLLLSFSSLVSAQSLATGLYPLGSFDTRGFDSINLGNLNIHFEIPLVNKRGRGMNFNYVMAYDGLIWNTVSSGGISYWTPAPDWGFSGQLNGSLTGYTTYNYSDHLCTLGQGSIKNFTNFVFHDSLGGTHLFNYSYGNTTCGGASSAQGDGSTSDGSGLRYGFGTVFTPDGRTISAPIVGGLCPSVFTTCVSSPVGGSVTDSNGNTITVNANGTFLDTLGVTALTISGSGNASSPLSFTYPVTLQADNSLVASSVVNYKTYTVQTNFQCPGISEYSAPSTDLIDHITLADGSTYSFTYEPTPGVSGAVTGRLESVTLPTGGIISYSYSYGCSGAGAGINADGTVGSLTRVTSDGTRIYGRSPINANATSTILQDEAGSQTLYQFTIAAQNSFYETHRQVYQGAVGSSLLLDQSTCYNGVEPPCDGAAIATPIIQTNVVSSYNGGSQSEVSNVYDYSGMVTSSTQKAFGGATLQYTATTYNALEEPTSVLTMDASGNTVSHVTYGYDETTPTATSGIPQHGATSATRGNRTSTHIQLASGSIDSTTAYYDTGVPASTTSPNGLTQYGYDPTQAFVNQVISPTPSSGVQLSSSASYDPQSGVQLSATGMNAGQTVQNVAYDPLLRPKRINFPDGGSQTYNYYSAGADVTAALNATTSANTSVQYDGYGRTSRVAVFNGQASNAWYQIDYCYDPVGRLRFQSSKYQGPGFVGAKQCSGSGTTYSYDALGRVTTVSNLDGNREYLYKSRAFLVLDVNGTQKITQYDLLGRISAICEISTNTDMPGSSALQECGTDIAQIGLLTTYTYDLANHKTTITQGGQQRVFQTDTAGRTIYTNEPERGVTTYGYAYNSTGLVVTRQRPRANQSDPNVKTTTTTQYDSIGRVVSVGYDDGTPNRSFAYDASANWAEPQANLKGNLSLASAAGAYTMFSYDSMGRTTMNAQCLPSECGNAAYDKQVSYTYDWAGNLTHEIDPASGSIAYTRSAAGEVTSIINETYSLSGGAGQITMLSNVQNGPFGPLTWTLGNGLTGIRTYDGLGRVNGGWACDGSAQPECPGVTQLYGFNAGWRGSRLLGGCDTIVNQCLNYGYDEFDRLTSRTVWQGAAENFQYTYDRWGNRWQQTSTAGGGPQPAFTYNTSNQIVGFSYDATGNLTNDGIHSYAYDADGNLIRVDNGSTAINTYDALNHRIRTQVPNVTVDSVYDIAGRITSNWTNHVGQESHIFWDNAQLAFRSYDGVTYFSHKDWVGTDRVHTDPSGAAVATYRSLPFGDGGSDTYSNNPASWDFNSFGDLDYNGESDSYRAQFRQYSPTQGRWMSPDPYDGSMDPSNPQSFNRYVYARNNPLAFVDSSGLTPIGVGYCSVMDIDTLTPGGCESAGGQWLYDGGGSNCNIFYCEGGSGTVTEGGGGSSENPSGGGGGSSSSDPSAPNNTACNTQRATSGAMGAANLGLAVGKGFELGGAVAGLGVTGVGAPAAAVLGVYGTVSIFGQGLTGAAQLYSAATGNYGTAARVAQIGNILSGPVSGLGTLLRGGSLAAAERNAGYESAFTAGAGLIDAIRAGGAGLPLAMSDHSTAQMSLFGAGGGNACGAGH